MKKKRQQKTPRTTRRQDGSGIQHIENAN